MHPEVKAAARVFLEQVREAFGDKLVSVYLYGSGAGPDYVPGRSDVNFLVIAEEVTMGAVAYLSRFRDQWVRRRIALPVLFGRKEFLGAADTFPLELLDLKQTHHLLYGEDLLAGIQVEPEDIRRAVERELKVQLLSLRRGYITVAGESANTRRLLESALSALIPVLRGLLVLSGVEPPARKPEVLRKIAEQFGLDVSRLLRFWELKQGEPATLEEVDRAFWAFHAELSRLALKVDEMLLSHGR